MTFQDVFDRLGPIRADAERLLRDTSYASEGGGLTCDAVAPLSDEYEDGFLRDQTREILSLLEEMDSRLCYLSRPLHGEHTIHRLPNGRYGYSGANGFTREFTCGERLEAKIIDFFGDRMWITARIEHDGRDYFLAGFRSISLDGLTIRERW